MNANRKIHLRLTPTRSGVVGTARRAVRAEFSGATKRFPAPVVAGSARSARAGTPQRGVPTVRWRCPDASGGFTLTELLVVLVTLGILAAMLLPALAATQPRSKAYQCLNNMRQLALAWTLYADENNERLVINSDPHTANSYLFPAGTGSPSWATGILDWSKLEANTNTLYLTSPLYSDIATYLNGNYTVFACPAAAYFVSSPQRTLGWDHRVRSVSMNAAVGDGYKYGVNPTTGTGSPWGWNPWYVARKTTDFNNPGPSQTWVFTDEHPDSIDDEIFYASPYPTTTFTELPADQHDGAVGMTFGDGHAEMHRWTGPVVPNRPVEFAVQQLLACSTTDPDMIWLAQHTPQPQ